MGKFAFENRNKAILKKHNGAWGLPYLSNARKGEAQTSKSKLIEVTKLFNETLMEQMKPVVVENLEFDFRAEKFF